MTVSNSSSVSVLASSERCYDCSGAVLFLELLAIRARYLVAFVPFDAIAMSKTNPILGISVTLIGDRDFRA